MTWIGEADISSLNRVLRYKLAYSWSKGKIKCLVAGKQVEQNFESFEIKTGLTHFNSKIDHKI